MAEEVSEKPRQEEEKPVPKEVVELYSILEKIHSLQSSTEHLLKELQTISSQKTTQQHIEAYSHELALIPETLQLLNDLRRHIPSIENHSSVTRNNLVALRGEEDAITSEEARVIVACASARVYIMNSIRSLEFLLAHIRQTSHVLLELISFHEPGFTIHVKESLPVLRLDMTAQSLANEYARLASLCNDLEDLYALDDHVEEVRDA